MYKRRSMSDYIYEELRSKIVHNLFKPDDRLVEEKLAKLFEVSRTPLRQALDRLEFEKLVIKKKNGRIYVSPLSIEEAIEIYQVREVLEGLVAKEATKKITAASLTKMEDVLILSDRAYEESRNNDAIVYGFQFHNLLYELSANRTAIEFLKQIRNRIERYRQIGEYKHSRYINHLPNKEHHQILELIRNEDEKEVEVAMRSHIQKSLNTTIESIQELSISPRSLY